MKFADSYMQRAYARGGVDPYPALFVPVEVDLSGLPAEEQLALAVPRITDLENQVAMLKRMMPVQGCEGR